VANSPQCGIIKTKEVSHEYDYQAIRPAVDISRAEGKPVSYPGDARECNCSRPNSCAEREGRCAFAQGDALPTAERAEERERSFARSRSGKGKRAHPHPCAEERRRTSSSGDARPAAECEDERTLAHPHEERQRAFNPGDARPAAERACSAVPCPCPGAFALCSA